RRASKTSPRAWPSAWLAAAVLVAWPGGLRAGPVVTEMQPRHGRPGTRVVFTGKELHLVNAVKFGAALADWEAVTVIDGQGRPHVFEIHTTVPNAATTARPILATPVGDITMPMPFAVAPRITGFHPARGWEGTIVTIEGQNFTGVTAVKFGGHPVSFSVTAATQIRAVVTPGVADGAITVSHEESGTSGEPFVVAGPGPIIDILDSWVGAPGDSVVIRGVNFKPVTAVWFGSARASFAVVADTQLKATVPLAASGKITLASALGQASTAKPFTITRAPVITSISTEVAAPGMKVTLRGVNFRQVTAVHVGAARAAGHSSPSPQQLDFTVPANATSSLVKVTNPFGVGTSGAALTVTRAPVVESFDPTLAKPGGWVTLRGANFTGATRVLLGSMSVRFIVTAPTQIRVELPLNAATGALTVQNAFGSGTTTGRLTLIGDGPHLTGFEPATGVAGTRVKLHGRNLDRATAVEFGGMKAAAFNAPASTQLSVTVPPDARSGPVKLLSALGDFSSAENFFLPPRLAKPEKLAAKPGDEVEFTGRNFLGLESLRIGGQVVPFEVVANDRLKFTVADDLLGGGIELVAPGGSWISTNSFAILPRIDSFEPVIGPAQTMVTIRGAGFHKILFLKFGTGVAEFEQKSARELLARLPSNASTGPVSIITPDGEVASDAIFTATAPGDLQMSSTLARPDYHPEQPVEINSRLVFFGPTVATQVMVTNQLPPGVTLLAAKPEPTQLLGDGRTLVYALGQVEPGATADFELMLMPLAKGQFTNVIRATALEGDVVPSNNGALARFVVYEPDDIRLAISADSFRHTFTLSWMELGLPVRVETSSFLPSATWRDLPFEPWIVGGRTFVTLKKFGYQAYFRLRMDLPE
ncbi:MAG: IPT/TIG domain-containing protein, partial [Verrucomicrobiota bacterium]|nr:IPT/TIG domain-containing protein [Verrucomicrobiota bacterium]